MRLIDADELVSEFACRMDDGVEKFLAKNVIGFIDAAHTVDAVPVVRCKDCVLRSSMNGGYVSDICPYWYAEGSEESDDFFCAFGERKTE